MWLVPNNCMKEWKHTFSIKYIVYEWFLPKKPYFCHMPYGMKTPDNLFKFGFLAFIVRFYTLRNVGQTNAFQPVKKRFHFSSMFCSTEPLTVDFKAIWYQSCHFNLHSYALKLRLFLLALINCEWAIAVNVTLWVINLFMLVWCGITTLRNFRLRAELHILLSVSYSYFT